MPIAHVNNEQIYYELEGSGPPLVLVHSLGTSSALWRDSIEHWKGSRTVLAMDCRGHGKSSNHGAVTLQAIAQDLRALVDQLQLGPIDLVGISMGGLIATHFYTAAPDQVRRIVLADTFAKMPEGEKRLVLLKEKLAATGMAEFGREYAAQTLLPSTDPERHRQLAEWVAATSREAYFQTIESLYLQDTRALLPRIAIPALVVIGDQDQRTPVALSNEIMSLLNGARMEVIPQSGHLPPMDNPGALHQAIDRFLEAHPEQPQ